MPGLALPLLAEETVVGTYTNPAPWKEVRVVLTNKALYIFGECGRAECEKVAWSEIEGCEFPSKVSPDGVVLVTRAGRRLIRAAGCRGPDGKFKDAFAFLGLFRHVIAFRSELG